VESISLCPIEDRCRLDPQWEGMFKGLCLGNYVLLVGDTARLFREGKAAISRVLAEISEWLGSSGEKRQMRRQKLRTGRLLGRFFAASRERLREVRAGVGLSQWYTSPFQSRVKDRRLVAVGGPSTSWTPRVQDVPSP
jgi:hypothetical protein